jgi:hypothetical protein
MPRGGKRLARRHQSGTSNRRRAIKAPDPVTCCERDPDERVLATNELAASMNKLGLSRSVSILEPPELQKTKLGGFYYSEVRTCTAPAYSENLEETYEVFKKARFVQPDWNGKQPPLGIPVWSNDPPQTTAFGTDGKSAPHMSATDGGHAVAAMRPPAGIPTRGIHQTWNL